jgi:hypothetical protein
MLKSVLWVLGGVGVGVVLMVVVAQLSKPAPSQSVSAVKASSQPSPTFFFDPEIPPKEALVGKILSFSGEVKWRGRAATEGAKLSEVRAIQQGEELETEEGGKVVVEFPDILQMTALEKSHLNFAQTLPVNLVVVQSQGIVDYHLIGDKKFSIRVLHLLVEQSIGNIVISIDPDQPLMTVNVKKGYVKIAFNDKDNLTNVVEVKEGERFVFDDEEREGRVR